ncbi:MAG TPA: YhdP family protein, partial [Albitalea sp.]|nr:YhdP family protein [Albitalea sp.]
MSIVAPVTAAAAPRSRRAVIAARLRWIASGLVGLVIAAWSLLLVAWLTLHWGILPHIQQWRPQIEQQASSALGVPVRIGNISVRSGGWMPTLELKDVVLQDKQSRPALQLPRVVAALSARSLFALELRFEQLLIDGAQLEIRRDATGRMFVAGLEFGGTGAGDNAAANWFFRQPEFVIRGGALRWTDEQRAAPPLSLADVQLIVHNGLHRHDIRLDATPPAEWGERFTLRGRFTQPLLADSGDWKRWSGVVYADLPRADVSELRRHVTLPFELNEGDGALRAWLDVKEGRPRGAAVDMALREVKLRLAHDVEPLALAQIEGRLSAQQTDDGWSMSARQFGFLTGDGIRWPRSDLALHWRQREGEAARGGDLSAQRLDLALMAQIASRVPLGEAVRKLLAELNPQGIVSDLALRWSGPVDAPATYQVKGLLTSLSLAAKPAAEVNAVGRPGLRNASIALEATEKGGEARLNMVNGALELPGVFEDPLLAMDQLGATLQWRIAPTRKAGAPSQVTLDVHDLKFANADAQGELSGQWSTGAGEGMARGGRYPGLIELDGRVAHGLAARVARYLPLGLPEDTRSYVARAVRAGSVSDLKFRVKGDLWDFPFHRMRNPKEGEFRIAGHVQDVELAYVPSRPASGARPAFESPWPAFSKVQGELIFDRASMEIRDARARVYGVELANIQGGIRNLAEHQVLAIEGGARGPLQDMLRYVNTSPVGTWIHKALAQASGSGVADLKLALAIPLADADKSTVKGSVTLAGNDVRIAADTPLLGAAKARVDFTHKGFSVVGGAARVLGGDAVFSGGSQADGSIGFTGQGLATAEGLRRAGEMGMLSRLAGSFSGQARYRVSLGVVRGHAELNVTSDLVGLASELPPPLRKSADTPLALRYGNTLLPDSPAAGTAARDTLRFELGNVVQAQFVRDLSGDTPRVLRGGIGVLDAMPLSPSGVAASVNLASFDLDAWQAVADRLGEGNGNGPVQANGAGAGAAANASASGFGGYEPRSIALRARELVTGSRRLNNVVAGISQDDGLWRANLDAEQLNGYVEYRPARRSTGAGRVYARLSRLSIPKSDTASVENLLDQQASSVPALDIVVDDLELRGKRLGRVEVEALNRTMGEGREALREWRLTRLAVTVPEAKFVANGQWAATGPGGRRRSVLNFKLDLADSGALLDRLGTPKAVRGGKGSLAGQIAWLGSPLALDYPSLTGQVNVAIDSGQFLKV